MSDGCRPPDDEILNAFRPTRFLKCICSLGTVHYRFNGLTTIGLHDLLVDLWSFLAGLGLRNFLSVSMVPSPLAAPGLVRLVAARGGTDTGSSGPSS